MDDKESLNFKIGLSGTSSYKKPQVVIKVNDVEYFNGFLSADKDVTEYIEFSAEIVEGSHELQIMFCNKEDSDTVKDDNGTIIDDFLLNIDSIEIDEIDLGILKWSISNYRPIYSPSFIDVNQRKITDVKNCVNLGWNGTWSLPFTSPFYVWLLENI
jgi:hypothetical protein